MNKLTKLFLTILLLVTSSVYPQVKPSIPPPERIRTYDVNHIKIDVSFNWSEKKVYGEAETKIIPLADDFTEFEVDAVAFNINFIRDDKGNDLIYSYDGSKIKINTGKKLASSDEFVYTVNYNCIPQRGLYFIYPNELNPSLPYQIWTQGERDDNRYWIPLYDYPNDKTTFEIYVTIDDKFKTLSNGYLDYSRKISDGQLRQDHWVMDKPNSTYLIMLAAGEFSVIEDLSAGIPVQSYVDKNIDFDNAAYTFRNTAALLEYFSEIYGAYPWNKYAQVIVEDFLYGGMENTTATVMARSIISSEATNNDYNSESTIFHELGHQWWGDVVTCRDWNDMWLNESFATFSESMWKEKVYGQDEYDYDILRNGDNSLRIDSVVGRYPIWAGYGSVTTNLYDKGSVVLNSFRSILGEDFFPALRKFLNDNQFKNVTTNDLIRSFNEQYNSTHDPDEDLTWMFDQWIMKAGHPELHMNYEYDETSNKVLLNIKQIQKTDSLTPIFRLPVMVRLKNSNEDKLEKILIDGSQHTFKFDLNGKPDMVVFDAGNNILDKVFFDKPFSDWKAQLEQSEEAVDRIMALRGLEIRLKDDDSQTAGKPPITINQIDGLRLLENSLNGDSFWGVRAEAAKILAKNFILDRTSTILIESYALQSDSRIKREILRALGKSNRPEDADFIKSAIQNENNDYIVADGITALGSLQPADIIEFASQYKSRNSHRNVILYSVISAMNAAAAKTDDARIKNVLMEIAFGTDIEGRVRSAAINGLRKFATDQEVKSAAMKNSDYNFIPVRRALVNLLAASGDKTIIPFLNDMKEKSTDDELDLLINTSVVKLEETK